MAKDAPKVDRFDLVESYDQIYFESMTLLLVECAYGGEIPIVAPIGGFL